MLKGALLDPIELAELVGKKSFPALVKRDVNLVNSDDCIISAQKKWSNNLF